MKACVPSVCLACTQGLNLDLTADLQPPKELHVEVRVLNDCGEIMTDHVSSRQASSDVPLQADSFPLSAHLLVREMFKYLLSRRWSLLQGSVKLDRGTTHLLRRSDVEHLVRQGLLQELENEST